MKQPCVHHSQNVRFQILYAVIIFRIAVLIRLICRTESIFYNEERFLISVI